MIFSRKGTALLSLLLCLMLLVSCFAGTACAESTIRSEVTYHSVTLKKPVSWTFEYSDAWFEKDADAYSHSVARASLGLAMSGFRSKTGAPDENVLAYLTDLGFTDLVSEDYLSETSIDTIGTVIGRKQLPSGDTLLVVCICGQGYSNEWLSNFDIGDQQEHKGFSSAAQKVVSRVETYLADRQISNARLWMSGYSRSAAVSNLAGGELLAKGLFSEKNAFIYTFATPNATRNPVPYANIFNITGKFDPVAKVPYREWGFDRHGTTLYTPAQETDSDYRQRQAAADAVFYELTGVHLWNSPTVNQHLSIIEAYLLSNVPTTEAYDTHMRQVIAEAWNKPSLSAALTVLRTMASIPSPNATQDAKTRSQRVDELINYVASAMLGLTDENFVDPDLLESEQISLAAPFVLEHIPDVYLSWMFSSDDPQKIFSDRTAYTQLVVSGDADVNLFDQKGGFIVSMSPEGERLDTTENERYLRRMRPVEDRPMIATVNTEEKNLFILPKDQGFPFTIVPRSEDELMYFGVHYDIRQSAPTMSSVYLLNMELGEEYLGFSLTPQGQVIMNAEESLIGDSHEMGQAFEIGELLTVTETDLFAGMNPTQISVRGILYKIIAIAVGVLLLLILLIVLAVCLIRRSIRKRRSKKQTQTSQEP